MRRLLLQSVFLCSFFLCKGQSLQIGLSQSGIVWPGILDLGKANFSFSTYANPLSLEKISNYTGISTIGLFWNSQRLRLGIKTGFSYGTADRIIRDYYQPTEYEFEPLHEKQIKNYYFFHGNFNSATIVLSGNYMTKSWLTLGVNLNINFVRFGNFNRSGYSSMYMELDSNSNPIFGPYTTRVYPCFYGGKSNLYWLGSADVEIGCFLNSVKTQRIFLNVSFRKAFEKQNTPFRSLQLEYFAPPGQEFIGEVTFKEDFRALGFGLGIEQSFNLKPKKK